MTIYIVSKLRKDMLDVWFDGAEHTEASQLIADRLFASGVFGTHENSLKSMMLKQVNEQGSLGKAKAHNWLTRIFLPLDKMKGMYPILEKCPILLPVMWVVRWCDVLLHRRGNIRMCVQEEQITSNQAVDEYHEMLRKSGLDFNFK